MGVETAEVDAGTELEAGAGVTPAVSEPSVDAATKAAADWANKTAQTQAAQDSDEAVEAEAAKESKKPESKTETDEDKAPVLDRRLQAAAKDAGIAVDEAPDQRTVALLEKLADANDRITRMDLERAESVRATREETPAVKPAAQAKETAEEPPTVDLSTPFAFDLSTEEAQEMFGGETKRVVLDPMAARQNASEARQSAFEAKLTGLLPYLEAVKSDHDQREAQEIDTFFTSIEKDFADIFGKGSAVDLKSDSPELKARRDLDAQAYDIQTGRLARREKCTTQQALEAALLLAHTDRVKKQTEKALIKKAKQRNAHLTAPPSASGSAGVPRSAESAVSAVAGKLREMGLVPS